MTPEESLERDLRRAFERQATTPCPGEDSVLAFYRGRLSEDEGESIREHLAECAACVEVARDARGFLEAMEAAPQPARFPRTAWLAAAAALLVAAIGGLWMARPRPAAPAPAGPKAAAPPSLNPWRNLPVAAAAYRSAPEDELVFRSNEPGGSAFAQAMIPYARGDYGSAEASLARFLEAHPGHADAEFYRGVSLLLLGRAEAARPLLASAAAATPANPESRWYLALALLKSGDARSALEQLDAVMRAHAPHEAEASRLAAEIRRASGSR